MAVSIADAINDIPVDCATISANAGISLLARFNVWINGIFAAPAVSTWNDIALRSNRLVMDWYGPTIVARQGIPAGNNDTNIIHEGRITDVVNRTLWAFRKAIEDGDLAAGIEPDVVAAYNAAWL